MEIVFCMFLILVFSVASFLAGMWHGGQVAGKTVGKAIEEWMKEKSEAPDA